MIDILSMIKIVGTKLVSEKVMAELEEKSTKPEKVKVVTKYMLKNGFNLSFIGLGILVVVNSVFELNIDFNNLFTNLARLVSLFNGF